MRLADFIECNTEAILAEWEAFAGSLLPEAGGLDAAALRDHAETILLAIARDLRAPQTREEQDAKSKGPATERHGAPETAAETQRWRAPAKGSRYASSLRSIAPFGPA